MMKVQIVTPFVVAAAIAAASCTPGTLPEAPPADTAAPAETARPAALSAEEAQAQVTKLEHDWVAAILKKDPATLDSLLADDFNGTSPTAHVYSKAMAIEDITKGTYVVESMNLDEVSVNSYGDVAVAFTSQEEKSKYGGADTSGHYHYTDVWIRRAGRWEVVASHGTRYDKGHGA